MKIIKIKWIMQLQLFHHHHREKYILILVGLLDWSILMKVFYIIMTLKAGCYRSNKSVATNT